MSDDLFKKARGPAAPAKPKIGILRLIVFAMIAFWLFGKFVKNRAEVDGPALPGNEGVQVDPQRPRDALPTSDRPLPSRDWHIDDPEGSGSRKGADEKQQAVEPRPTTGPRRSTETRTTDSDWSIEEVESKPSTNPADNETRFDPTGGTPQKNAPQNGKAKKTTEGDWSIEEVESKK